MPTDAYSLEEAVRDGFLVPPKAVSVPLKFQREGIKYDELSEEEKDQWDALEWDEEGTVPDRVEAEAVNKWLFNKDTVDKVLEHLMTRGQRVAGGDRLGKTIIFAKNQAPRRVHRRALQRQLPALTGGEFARVITFKTEYAQSLIDDFSNKEKAPHIAISVDMLDTGIDVPEVVNLVFFKLVRSKTKFWQMLGRGTRLCPDLFGPGQDKEFFFVFDYCQNLEYFSQDIPATEGSAVASLGKRLFDARLELVEALDGPSEGGLAGAVRRPRRLRRPQSNEEVRGAAGVLTARSGGDEPRQLRRAAAAAPGGEVCEAGGLGGAVRRRPPELSHEVAGLPSELDPEGEEAKRFDLLVLNLQLAMLRAEPGFERLREQVKEIAGLLEEKSAIPMVREQMALIQDVQTDEWWQDVTVPMLEGMRRDSGVWFNSSTSGSARSSLPTSRTRWAGRRRSTCPVSARARTTRSSGPRRRRSFARIRITSRSRSCG